MGSTVVVKGGGCRLISLNPRRPIIGPLCVLKVFIRGRRAFLMSGGVRAWERTQVLDGVGVQYSTPTETLANS